MIFLIVHSLSKRCAIFCYNIVCQCIKNNKTRTYIALKKFLINKLDHNIYFFTIFTC